MKRKANAQWTGDLKNGSGVLTTESLVVDKKPYSFATRFAGEKGTNPEELLAAAHAGCFTMSLAHTLTQKGFQPGNLATDAIVTIDMSVASITQIELQLHASTIEGLSEPDFIQYATEAKQGCMLSKALAGTSITMTVQYGNEGF